MAKMNVEISTFVSPHIFFVVDANAKSRTYQIEELSSRINAYHRREKAENFFEVDEMVYTHHEKYLVRAIIKDIISETVVEEQKLSRYYCWLVDYGVLIETNTVFKLCTELCQIEPLARHASLKNICFIREILSFECGYKKLTVPTIEPPPGLTDLCLTLISNNSQLTFIVSEEIDNILIGELVIQKNKKTIELSKELVKRGLALSDDRFYKEIKKNSVSYIKTNLNSIKQQCKFKKFKMIQKDAEFHAEEKPEIDKYRKNENVKVNSKLFTIKCGQTPFDDSLFEEEHVSMLLEDRLRKVGLNNSQSPNNTTMMSEQPKATEEKVIASLPPINSNEEQVKSRELEYSPLLSLCDVIQKKHAQKQEFCKIMTGGCECSNCKMAYDDDDWEMPIEFENTEKEDCKATVTANKIKPPQLLKKETSLENTEDFRILSVDFSSIPKLQKRMYSKILVHSLYIPNRIKLFSQVNIHKDIYGNLLKLHYEHTKKIQQYSMPALTRNDHVFMIGNSHSGKTMAYLPILCSFILEKSERYNQHFKLSGGPIVVILCSNSRKCEEIYHYTKAILNSNAARINLVTYPEHGNINNVDILITMPTVLSALILSTTINFKRLCHIVLEDGDVILKTQRKLITKFLEYADKVLEHRYCPKSVQLILCAEHWTHQIEDLLNKLLRVPLVCIGNYLEAAVYGKLKFITKIMKSTRKVEELERILVDVYKFTKSLIICHQNDVEGIETFLTMKGIEFISVNDSTEEDLIWYSEDIWYNLQPGKFCVFVCTDNVFNTVLTITNVAQLIHFSLPDSWSDFLRRFSCLIDNISTPLNTETKKLKLVSHIFIDENCERNLIRFCHYFKEVGLDGRIQENLKDYFKTLIIRQEQEKIEKEIHLCDTLKLFGKCDSLNCKQRHVLDANLDYKNDLPKNGLIRFKILKMNSTTTCSIRLIEHFDLNGQSIKQFQDFTKDINDLISRIPTYEPASTINFNQMYLYKLDDKYFRCIFIDISNSLLFFIDTGIYKKCNRSDLYEITEELKAFPQQTYEAYFANLIPPYEDTLFSQLSKEKAEFFIDSNCPNSVMRAEIHLQLGTYFWLHDVYEERVMYSKSLPIIGFQFTRELVLKNMAEKSVEPLQRLYDLSAIAGIELPNYNMKKTHSVKALKQVEPQWAWLDKDEITETYFSSGFTPHEFYLKHAKFVKILTDLEAYIQKEIKKPFYPSPKRIESGCCYLAKDEESGTYCRVLAKEIIEENVNVFFVDYGDEISVSTSSLKHITNEMIQKLPFQSIQCSLWGTDAINGTWLQSAIDVLYERCFEPDSNIFRSLYVKICLKQDNKIIAKQHSYSVILKDGYSQNQTIFNQLLIDCGFAKSDGRTIDDFNIEKYESDSESEEEIKPNEIIVSKRDILMHPPFNSADMEIFDLEEFVEQLKSQNNHEKRQTANTDISNNNYPVPLTVAPTVDYFTPSVLWSQTDTYLKLTILISDVQECKVTIIRNMIFNFSTEKNKEKYKLCLILFDKVEKTFQYTVFGQQIRVTLKKCDEQEWPRLLKSKKKVKKITYDTSAIQEEDEPKRRMLDLGISDPESDSGPEENKPFYYDFSDVDSDYDQDIPYDI